MRRSESAPPDAFPMTFPAATNPARRWRSWLQIASFALLAFAFTGCAKHMSQPIVNRISVGSLTADPVAPINPKALKEVTIGAKLANHQGYPVRFAHVNVSLVMPAMTMPAIMVTLREDPRQPGYYSGKATFTMPGDWRMDYFVNAGGQGTTTLQVPIQVQ